MTFVHIFSAFNYDLYNMHLQLFRVKWLNTVGIGFC